MLKTVSAIANAIGALNYKGTWNASTNTPALSSGVGTKGDYYVVSVAGATSLDGISNWGVGDWATFNGSVWQRVEGGQDGNFVNLIASLLATFGNATGQNGVFRVVVGAGGANEGIVVVTNPTGKGWIGFNNGNTASIPGQLTYDHSTGTLGLFANTGPINAIAGTNGVTLAQGGVAWGVLSDERFKNIDSEITGALSIMEDWRTVYGRYKEEDESVVRAFLIAQDVEKTFKPAVDATDGEKLLLMKEEVIPLLVAAIKELKAEINQLKGL